MPEPKKLLRAKLTDQTKLLLKKKPNNNISKGRLFYQEAVSLPCYNSVQMRLNNFEIYIDY